MASEKSEFSFSFRKEFYVVTKYVVFADKRLYFDSKSVFFGEKFSVTESVAGLPLIGFIIARDNSGIPHFARRFVFDINEQTVYVYGEIIEIISAYTPDFGRFIPT